MLEEEWMNASKGLDILKSDTYLDSPPKSLWSLWSLSLLGLHVALISPRPIRPFHSRRECREDTVNTFQLRLLIPESASNK